MSLTLGNAYKAALKHINTYSQNGTVITGARIADYEAQRVQYVNEALADLAANLGFPAKFRIDHYPVSPLTTTVTGFELIQHLNTDKILCSAVGAKCFTLEVSNPGTIYIEEETAPDTWSVLETVTVTGITQPTNYKSHFTASDSANAVRIRLSGSYPYTVTNYALYGQNWATDGDIQEWTSQLEYSMPDDFLRLDEVANSKTDYYQNNAKINFYKHNSTVKIPVDTSGSYTVYYFRKPTLLTDAATNDTVIDVPIECEEAVPFYMAMQFVKNQRPQIFNTLSQMYENFKNNGNVKQQSSAEVKLSLPDAYSTNKRRE